MTELIFGVGLAIFVTYMYFLVRMINTQHKISEKEHGKVQYKRKRVFKVNKEEVTDDKQ